MYGINPITLQPEWLDYLPPGGINEAEWRAAQEWTPKPIQMRPNHWHMATDEMAGLTGVHDAWQTWQADIDRLGYGLRAARRGGIDVDQAARDYLLLTVPVTPRLPEPRPRHDDIMLRILPLRPGAEMIQGQGFPAPPCLDESAARPLSKETSDRIEAGVRRWQEEAIGRIDKMQTDRTAYYIEPSPSMLDFARVLTERLMQAREGHTDDN